MSPLASRRPLPSLPLRAAVALLFFASGFAGLVHQVLWIRGFSQALGGTTQAMAGVLAAFMGGLGLGYALAGRLLKGGRSPLALYGWLELGVGALGLGVLALLQRYAQGPVLWQALGQPAWAQQSAGLAFTVLLVLPPTLLMGLTLPVLLRLEEARPQGAASATALYYGLNTLGAALGAFVAGFFLLRLYGMQASAAIASAINAGAGLLALLLDRWARPAVPAPAPGAPAAAPSAVDRFVLASFFVSGAASFGYEIVFSRFLGYTVGNRVFASATILSVFLAAMALGSLLAGPLLRWRGAAAWAFPWAQVLIGLWGCLVAAHIGDYKAWAQAQEAARSFDGAWQLVAFKAGLAALVLAPPALLFGLAFPAALRLLSPDRDWAAASGRAAAVNTLGCIAGSLAMGFVLIPWLGAWNSLLACALLSFALGHRWLAPRWETAGAGRRAVSALTALALMLALAQHAWQRRGQYPFARPKLQLLQAREDATALFTAWQGPYGFYIYADNSPLSFPMGARTRAEQVQRLQATLPVLLRPQARRALVVGLGFGTTSGSFCANGVMERVDSVELIPGLIDAMPLFAGHNSRLHEQPASRLIRGDGRHYLKDPPPYDIIASNLTDADLPGSAACYTLEYARLAKAALPADGLFLMHAYGEDSRPLLKTVAAVFEHVEAYQAYRGSLFIVAGREAWRVDPAAIDARLKRDPRLAREALRSGIPNGRALLGLRRLDARAVAQLAADPAIPLNTDDRPVIEYGMGRLDRLFRAAL